MKLLKLTLIAGFCFFALSTIGFSLDDSKIGLVDFQKILEKSRIGQTAQSEIKAQGEKMENSLKQKREEIEQLKKNLEREALVIDRGARDEKEREIRIKINDIKSLQKKYMSEFKELEGRLIKRIRGQLFEIIEKIGKENGYLLILEKRESGILYSPKSIDITDKLIRLYNEKFKK
ncbi:outer membrane protein [Candidatus Magnetomoraceae bacterium gMMP-15]